MTSMQFNLPEKPPEGVEDGTWLDVIHKMDEVYSQLVHDEMALEEKNAALEQSQQFIFSLLSAMSDVLIACDMHGIVQETNMAIRELTGKADAQLLGKTVWQLLDDNSSEGTNSKALKHAMEMTAMHRRSINVEIFLRDKNYQSVPVDFNCSVRRNHKGKRVGIVLVGRPLGELKRAYQQLNHAHLELKKAQAQLIHSEKMASLGRLVAGVAHELNNPISFVLGNVHALKKYTDRLETYLSHLQNVVEGVELDSNLRESTQILRQQLRIDSVLNDIPSLMHGTIEGAQRTADIVQGLKRFSAMDKAEHTPLEVAAVVRQAIHWAQKGTTPSFKINFQPSAELEKNCYVQGNAGQLIQVLINLIQNAYDAALPMQADQAELNITLEAESKNSYLELFFHDNGPGIPGDIVDKIFDPFFTTKPIGKGTGLGLSISHGIAEQHSGSLSVQSTQSGCIFVLRLPKINI